MSEQAKNEIEDLRESLGEKIGAHASPTPFLRFEDGRLQQKWLGHGGEVWVEVPSVKAPEKGAEGKVEKTS